MTIREENGAAALEVMSRFGADPRWLIYLPPTMSPSETCTEGAFLEHPREALAYFRSRGVPHVVWPEILHRLRSRGLKQKRSLALREFALGLAALHRFVEKEPLYRVHECVFGVLALESEPVDPRL